mgnify:CR=1 FL=1
MPLGPLRENPKGRVASFVGQALVLIVRREVDTYLNLFVQKTLHT